MPEVSGNGKRATDCSPPKNENPGPHSARGMNPSSSRAIIVRL